MIKKTIKFTDFNGDDQLVEFNFNLSFEEAMEFSKKYSKELAELTEDATEEVTRAFLKVLIVESYGHKSDDGMSFDHTPKEAERFLKSPAYDALLKDLLFDSDKAAAFFQGILNINNEELEKLTKAGAEASKGNAQFQQAMGQLSQKAGESTATNGNPFAGMGTPDFTSKPVESN